MAQPDRPISEILEDIVRNVQEIVRFELRLAKVELRRDTQKLLSSTTWMVIGAVCGLLGAAVLVTAIVAALALVVPVWESALLVGIGLAIIAAVLFKVGSRRFSELQAPLTQTIESLNETMRGTRAWISSND
jgi:high-affinity Fe2+/Pb2+ permease